MAFWTAVAVLLLSGLAGPFFASPAERAKERARALVKEVGLHGFSPKYTRVTSPVAADGPPARLGNFQVRFPRAWPELASVPSKSNNKVAGKGIVLDYSQPWLLNFREFVPRRGQPRENYFSKHYYQIGTTAEFLELLCTFDETNVESAESLFGSCANIEMMLTQGLLCFGESWSLSSAGGHRVFILHHFPGAFSGQADERSTFSLIVTDEQRGDLGGLILVAEKDAGVTIEQVLALAATIAEVQSPSASR